MEFHCIQRNVKVSLEDCESCGMVKLPVNSSDSDEKTEVYCDQYVEMITFFHERN